MDQEIVAWQWSDEWMEVDESYKTKDLGYD